MLLFGHAGITMAAVRINDLVFPTAVSDKKKSGFRYRISSLLDKLRDNSGRLDYRMVIIGSMLPDIIDKPLTFIFQDSGLFSGRGYAHTLLFSLLLLAGGCILKKSWLLTLFIADFLHLVLDMIWEIPVTLFWPLLGKLETTQTEGWLSGIWESLLTVPKVYIPEMIGVVIAVYFVVVVLRNRSFTRFVRWGNINREDG